MDLINDILHYCGRGLEVLGVVVITIGALYSLIKYLIEKSKKLDDAYMNLRCGLGKTLLLGLEILVAADIILTVTTDLELNRVLGLAIIIILRVILSFSLQVEIEGKLPWKQGGEKKNV